jgi:hypothetical protein
MPVSLHKNQDLGVISLLSILAIYAEAELQAKPYLIKDGIKIIL